MRRNGFVMVAVLIVVAAAILVASGAIFTAHGEIISARAAGLERRLRDAALDGVALAADALAKDREKILAGANPTLDALQLEIPDGDRRIEVRLIPQWNGELVESESAKIDANAASPELLEQIFEGSSDAAQQIVARIADVRPVNTIDAAVALGTAGNGKAAGKRASAKSKPSADASAGVEGDGKSAGGSAAGSTTKSTDALREVLGSLSAIGEARDALDETPGASRAREGIPPIVALLTAHAREPLVTSDGSPKLDLVAAFGDNGGTGRATASLGQFEDAEREILEKVSKQAMDSTKDSTKDSPDDGMIVKALAARGIDSKRIDAILDSCTLHAGTRAPARLDIVRADTRVLAAMDGIGADAASRIVDLRDSLDPAERKGTSWLVSRRVLTPDQYAAVAGRITNRTAVWRFRVEARMVSAADAADAPAGKSSSSQSSSSQAAFSADDPHSVYAFDCIVDIGDERPRIAMLRDVTLLPTAKALAFIAAKQGTDGARGNAGRGRAADGSDGTDGEDMTDDASVDASLEPASLPPLDAPDMGLGMPTIAPGTPKPASRNRVSPVGRDVGGVP